MPRQTIFLLLLIVVLAAGAYYWLKSSSSAPSEPETDPALEEIENKISDVRRLKTIEFNTSVMQDEVFRSLQDFATGTEAIIPAGRKNPFAPL